MNERSAAPESDVLRRLFDVMGAVFGIDPAMIDREGSSTTIPEWDSVHHLQLMLALEDEFGIQFDTDELATLGSIPLIERRLRGGEHGS